MENKFLKNIKEKYVKIMHKNTVDNLNDNHEFNEKENYLLKSAELVMERYHILFENDNAKYPSYKKVYPELTDDILKKPFLILSVANHMMTRLIHYIH